MWTKSIWAKSLWAWAFWRDGSVLGGAPPHDITGAGDIASAEAFGAPLVIEIQQHDITGVGGIESAEAFGLARIDVQQAGGGGLPVRARWYEELHLGIPAPHRITGAGSISSAEAFGEPLVVAHRKLRGRRVRDEEVLMLME